jgi:hypothetical protein
VRRTADSKRMDSGWLRPKDVYRTREARLACRGCVLDDELAQVTRTACY